MPVIETVLIYGVIPLAIFLVFAALTLLPGRGKDKTRYRPGQPWEHEAVWYEPHPEAAGVHAGGHGDEHADGSGRPGLGATARSIGGQPHELAAPRRTAAGGARGTW
ncbi:aa3-type cytochrome oxidase subunit CtaJ [Modestobacter lapidis]|nr:hypothetical protein [Modestobacter lapidis]